MARLLSVSHLAYAARRERSSPRPLPAPSTLVVNGQSIHRPMAKGSATLPASPPASPDVFTQQAANSRSVTASFPLQSSRSLWLRRCLGWAPGAARQHRFVLGDQDRQRGDVRRKGALGSLHRGAAACKGGSRAMAAPFGGGCEPPGWGLSKCRCWGGRKPVGWWQPLPAGSGAAGIPRAAAGGVWFKREPADHPDPPGERCSGEGRAGPGMGCVTLGAARASRASPGTMLPWWAGAGNRLARVSEHLQASRGSDCCMAAGASGPRGCDLHLSWGASLEQRRGLQVVPFPVGVGADRVLG